MSARILLEIAIRVLGLWFVFAAINSLIQSFSLYLPSLWGVSPAPPPELLVVLVAIPVVQGGFGAVVIWWAPWGAARFYAVESEDAQVHMQVGPGDVYRVACFVLGIYLLVHTAEPATRLAASLIRGASANWLPGQAVVDAVAVLTQAAAGLFLVFGSKRLGELLSNLRYDPDTIPKQQMSLAVLLSLILLFALVLGGIRWLMLGGI